MSLTSSQWDYITQQIIMHISHFHCTKELKAIMSHTKNRFSKLWGCFPDIYFSSSVIIVCRTPPTANKDRFIDSSFTAAVCFEEF